jgi:hypothetical protein
MTNLEKAKQFCIGGVYILLVFAGTWFGMDAIFKPYKYFGNKFEAGDVVCITRPAKEVWDKPEVVKYKILAVGKDNYLTLVHMNSVFEHNSPIDYIDSNAQPCNGEK